MFQHAEVSHKEAAQHSVPSITPEQARHDAKIEIEGERLINAALDKKHPHAFHDELAEITDPKERQEALAAAKTYEAKREKDGAADSALPKVEFYESDGKLGQVKVKDHGSRVAYDADKEEGQDGKTTQEKVKEAAVEKGKQAGEAVKGLWGKIKH